MNRSAVALGLVLLAVLSGCSATPSAQSLLAGAQTKAQAEKKSVLVLFRASWCSWCKRLDLFLDRPEIKSAFDKYFVLVELSVDEKKNKSLETPGAEAVWEKFGGPDGLPYIAFLDAKGSLLVTSKHAGKNIGYPGEPGEIDWFVEMVKAAAPNVTDAELKTIRTTLEAMAPK